jgi:hypothetical protein
VARQQIERRAKLDKGAKVALQAFCVSSSHYVYIKFEVEGDSQISRIIWRMRGNLVEVEK